jgi:hypothetical protein
MEEMALDYIAQAYSRLGQRRVTCNYVDIDDPEIAAYRRFVNPPPGGQVDLPVALLDDKVALTGRFDFHQLLDCVEKAVAASESQ